MNTIPDLGQAHETCGVNKLVGTQPSPNDKSKEKIKENKIRYGRTIKNHRKSSTLTRELFNYN